MLSRDKKTFFIFALFILLAGFLIGLPADAQQPSVYTVEPDQDPRHAHADVHVHSVVLDQAIYAAGDVIEGTFAITNADSEIVATDIRYAVQLVGNFLNDVSPQTVFDYGAASEGITLEPGETTRLSFQYIIPEQVPTLDLGIQVQLYDGTNRMMTRSSTPFGLTGSVYDYLEFIAQVQVGGEPFGLLDAPTIYPGEQALFAISLQTERVPLRLTPTVQVYKNLLSGEELRSEVATSFFMTQYDQKEQRIALPLMNYNPGIYTALITYRDEDGILRAGPFEVRYVVADVAPTIASVGLTRLSDKSDDNNVVINVEVADTPVDIRLTNYEEGRSIYNDGLAVQVSAYDADGELLEQSDITSLQGYEMASFDFSLGKRVGSFKIVADLYASNVLVDRIERTYAAAPNQEFRNQNIGAFIVGTILFGALIAILFAIRFYLQKRKAHQNDLYE